MFLSQTTNNKDHLTGWKATVVMTWLLIVGELGLLMSSLIGTRANASFDIDNLETEQLQLWIPYFTR